jgi:hypothetical protein
MRADELTVDRREKEHGAAMRLETPSRDPGVSGRLMS